MQSDDFKILLNSAKERQLRAAKEHINKLNDIQNELIRKITFKDDINFSYKQDVREYANK